MYLVDSHCHLHQLDLTAHAGSLANALNAAKAHGVQHMLCVCITLDDFATILSLAKQYPHISISVGLHPNEPTAKEPTSEELSQLASDDLVVAIGETGLDYFRSEGDLTWQHERFRQHIRAAITVAKPLIVHSRQARLDTLRILQEENAASVGGVLHCFTEDWTMARAALDLGFYISISGIVTFANAKDLQAVAKQIPLDRLLIETDAPYLAPVPFRGKPNEPGYVRFVAEYLANLQGISLEAMAEITTTNFFNCFKTAKR